MNFLLLNYLKLCIWIISLLIILGCSSPSSHQNERNNEISRDKDEVPEDTPDHSQGFDVSQDRKDESPFSPKDPLDASSWDGVINGMDPSFVEQAWSQLKSQKFEFKDEDQIRNVGEEITPTSELEVVADSPVEIQTDSSSPKDPLDASSWEGVINGMDPSFVEQAWSQLKSQKFEFKDEDQIRNVGEEITPTSELEVVADSPVEIQTDSSSSKDPLDSSSWDSVINGMDPSFVEQAWSQLKPQKLEFKKDELAALSWESVIDGRDPAFVEQAWSQLKPQNFEFKKDELDASSWGSVVDGRDPAFVKQAWSQLKPQNFEFKKDELAASSWKDVIDGRDPSLRQVGSQLKSQKFEFKNENQIRDVVEEILPTLELEVVADSPVETQTDSSGMIDRMATFFEQASEEVISDLTWMSDKITKTGQQVSEFGESLYRVWDAHLKERREEEIYKTANSVRNLASEIKNHIDITTPEISDHIRTDIETWVNLSIIDRNELRFQKQGIMDKYGLSVIPVDIRRIAIETENQDTLQNVRNWSNLTYEERRGVQLRSQGIRSQHDVSSLPENLQNLITEIEASDEQKKIETENQWARLRARATGAESSSLIANENPEMEEYQFLGIKLFPIHIGDSAYPRTRRNNMELSLTGQNMKLEIHSSTNLINYEILTEYVQEIQLIMECPDQPDCRNNIIRFNSDGYWDEYYLDQLIDYQNTGAIHYIKITPSELDGITEMRRGSITRSYRGSFRIQFAQQTKNSELLEWSLINDLHIEEYIRSVVPSEIPTSASIEALKAQSIAARSFVLNHMRMARIIKFRKWDVNPTTQFQLYLGVEEEHPRSDRAVEETKGIVLAYRGRLALTEYFSCADMATNDDATNPVITSRNIPSYILCEDYDHISQNRGHGRGLPQIIIMELASDGWQPHADNLPTGNAVVPENFSNPWNYEDILLYFYNGVSLYHYTNIKL